MTEAKSSFWEINKDIADKTLQVTMKKALDDLPECCRLIFVLRRLEGLSVKLSLKN